LCVMYFFHICTILRWEDFLHRSVLIYIYIWNVEKLVTFYLFHYKKMLKDIFLEVNFLSFCRKWWKYRDEEMKHSVNVYLLHLFSAKFTHKLSNYDIDLLSNFRYPLALSKRASLTLKFWMLWNEVCLYQAQSITGVIGLDSF
ncbi:hypothetical protein T01_11965, partial [Trichinella spiralis]